MIRGAGMGGARDSVHTVQCVNPRVCLSVCPPSAKKQNRITRKEEGETCRGTCQTDTNQTRVQREPGSLIGIPFGKNCCRSGRAHQVKVVYE